VDEAHIAVISDFHLVIVRLPNWETTPKTGGGRSAALVSV
jgi:hypothetical protein